MSTPTDHLRVHPVNRIDLLSALIDEKRVSRVEVKQVDLTPGQVAGCHFHPCPVVGYICQGSIVFQVEGATPRLLNAGEAFHEPANKSILRFDNASQKQPAQFIAFYLLSADDQVHIQMGPSK